MRAGGEKTYLGMRMIGDFLSEAIKCRGKGMTSLKNY